MSAEDQYRSTRRRGTHAHINQIRLVPHMKIMDNGRLVEVSEFSHVICFVKLCGVDLIDAFRMYISSLVFVNT